MFAGGIPGLLLWLWALGGEIEEPGVGAMDQGDSHVQRG